MTTFSTLSGPLTGKYRALQRRVRSFPVEFKLTSTLFPGEMIKSKLPNNVLGKIWKLSDVDKDGMLDSDEFALAMHLINVKLDGEFNHLGVEAVF